MNFEINKLDQKLVSAGSVAAGRVHWFEEIASTNSFIAQHQDPHGRVCLAGLQTAGRGQRGKQWQAPAMSSVLMSVGWRLPDRSISGLSLVCGLAVKQTLDAMQVSSVSLKWPNDVLLNGSKLGGVLVEVTGRKVVVGIGMNVDLGTSNLTTQYPVDTKLPWTDLIRNGHQLDFHNLIAELIIQLTYALEKFVAEGFDGFRESWMQAHYFHEQLVMLCGTENIEGKVTGVDSMGGLILDVAGISRVFYAGEVSMTPVGG